MIVHKTEIVDAIKKERIMTTSEVAKLLKVSWNTAEKLLLELALEGVVERIKKERANLWLAK